MARKMTRVLLIAGNDDDAERVRASLVEYHPGDSPADIPADEPACDFTRATTLAEGVKLLAAESFDIIIADLDLPDAHGLMVFAVLYAQAPETPIIVLVDSSDELLALKAVQHGAQDYILKDQVHGGLVARATQYAVQYRAAEEELARERERLAVTLRSIGEGVITTDTSGRVKLINRIAEELTGWPQEEGRGRHLDEIFTTIDEETGQPRTTPLSQLFAGELATELGTAILADRNGRQRLIESTGAPLRDRDGATMGAVIAFRDITTQRQLQEERIRADKLESIGELAGGIAHDFNNLLVGILGNLSLLREETTTAAERRELLAAAETATMKARDLARQLLTFATGGAPIKATTNINSLLTDTVRLALSGSSILADLSLDQGLWPVEVDEAQFTQALTNLIHNARQAMPAGGTLRVTAENLDAGDQTGESGELDLLEPGRYLRISIEDEGHGIDPELVPRIFDPYFTTRDGASGLGLAIAYSIITRHGGRITAHSVPGEGSTFRLYIPAAAPVPTRDETAAPAPEHDRPARVLLMDDDEMVRQVAGRMVEWLGYEVATAVDGAEALDLYREAQSSAAPFSLVIMDLTVPGGMGGAEAIRHLRDLDPNVAAIVSSGYFNDPVMANYRSHGFDGIIAKPYQLDNLRDAIERVLGWTP